MKKLYMFMAVYVSTYLTTLSGFAANQSLDSSKVLRALQEELQRSFEKLPSQDSIRPYFISYLIWEIESYELEYSYGALISEKKGKESFLKTEVSVGKYKKDNHFYQGNFDYQRPFFAPLPQDLNPGAVKNSAWAATDAAYKNALQQYQQKMAYASNKKNSYVYEDNTPQAAQVFFTEEPLMAHDSSNAKDKLRKISKSLLKDSHLMEDKISYRSYYTRLYYVDSEGSKYIQKFGEYTLLAALLTQGQDGAPLWDYSRFTSREGLNPNGLNSFARDVLSISQRLKQLANIKASDYYRGPVLFQSKAAPQIISSVLLNPQRRIRGYLSDVNNQHFLTGLLGKKYFPNFIQIVDIPAQDKFQGKRLHGHYLRDHEGVPAKKLDLVKDGKLKTLFSGRRPVLPGKGHQSNGHSRYGELLPSVVELSSDKKISSKKLYKKLKKLAREEGVDYALVVSKFADEEAYQLLRHPLAQYIDLGIDSDSREGTLYFPQILEADKLDLKTGKLSPVVGLQLNPSDSRMLRSLIYTGKEKHLLEPRAIYSIISPDLLFELVDLKSEKGQYPHKPRL